MKTLKKYIAEYEGGRIYTAFDTETTGLSRVKDRVIEIGAVKFDRNGLIGVYNELIYPEMNVPEQSIRIHGITDAQLEGKPVFRDIADSFLDFIKDTVLIAHNSSFDITFINKELNIAGRRPLAREAFSAIDTVFLSRKVFPEFERHTLQFLAGALDIPSGNAHRASDDARVCMEVFRKCITRAEQQPGL